MLAEWILWSNLYLLGVLAARAGTAVHWQTGVSSHGSECGSQQILEGGITQSIENLKPIFARFDQPGLAQDD
jgi:hypothetical protein